MPLLLNGQPIMNQDMLHRYFNTGDFLAQADDFRAFAESAFMRGNREVNNHVRRKLARALKEPLADGGTFRRDMFLDAKEEDLEPFQFESLLPLDTQLHEAVDALPLTPPQKQWTYTLLFAAYCWAEATLEDIPLDVEAIKAFHGVGALAGDAADMPSEATAQADAQGVMRLVRDVYTFRMLDVLEPDVPVFLTTCRLQHAVREACRPIRLRFLWDTEAEERPVQEIILQNGAYLYANFCAGRVVKLLPCLSLGRRHFVYRPSLSGAEILRNSIALDKPYAYARQDTEDISAFAADDSNGFFALEKGKVVPFSTQYLPELAWDDAAFAAQCFVDLCVDGVNFLLLRDDGRVISNLQAAKGWERIASVWFGLDHTGYAVRADGAVLSTHGEASTVPATANTWRVECVQGYRGRDALREFAVHGSVACLVSKNDATCRMVEVADRHTISLRGD